MSNKSDLRKEFLNLRNEIDPETEEKSQEAIDNKVFWFIKHYGLKVIGLYASKDKEVETRTIIDYALDNDLDVYLPKVEENNQMSFYLIRDFDADLELNERLNLYEPIVEKTLKLADPKLVEAYFMPLICFDDELNRIGYGQGYYDRYFANLDYRGYKIGLARQIQFSSQKIDSDPFDIKLDFVITDGEVYINEKQTKKFNFNITYSKLN